MNANTNIDSDYCNEELLLRYADKTTVLFSDAVPVIVKNMVI
jgi:hypothetical protein